jgi:hypothetical protein
MQSDGNLCLNRVGGGAIWCSAQAGNGFGQRFMIEDDGALCLHDGPSVSCFSPGPHDQPAGGVYLLVEDDGHMVAYNGVSAYWTVP